jgi:hypothetical protein
MNKLKQRKKNPLWKVILTDILGVLLLLLVPILGTLPGPGGIPLLISGFGLLAINHDWADGAVDYVKTHSESLRNIIFPDNFWVMWAWDIFVVILLVGGTWLNFVAEGWFLKGLSYGIMASSTTLFMLNRNRITWLDNLLRRTGKK